MEDHHLHHHHYHYQKQQQQQQKESDNNNNKSNVEVIDRITQWSIQETKEFLMIRVELDEAFMETKRNKQLWDVISNKMKDKGYLRSSKQCKCKWKNLVTRYKGCETMEAEYMRQQFPFYNELQAIFTSRMQRMLWTEASSEEGFKKKVMKLSSEDEEDGNEEIERDQHNTCTTSSNKKKKKGKIIGSDKGETSGGSNKKNLKEILKEFMRQQMEKECEWIEAFEGREKERKVKEMEWRKTMERLKNDRIMNDQRWREKEEQRRLREEVRAEKRDLLITTLLNKFTREEI